MAKLIDGEPVMCVRPPSFKVAMTGATHAEFATGNRWRLYYTDGTFEEAVVEIADWRNTDWFAIVGAVQRAARGEVSP